jgi:hypothetical protein
LGSQSPNLAGGLLTPTSNWGQYNQLAFIVQQLLGKAQTATVVKVLSCTNDGGLSPVGLVDLLPLVNQVDGNGSPTPHGQISNIPYFRIQGGTSAVIMDPQVGDLGIAIFASRDISQVKVNKTQSLPGSSRQFDWQDGMYLGGLLNGVPQQYVQFNSSGITINSPSLITLIAPTIALQGAVTMSEGLTVTDDVIANGISLDTHTHTSEAPGDPTSPPLP